MPCKIRHRERRHNQVFVDSDSLSQSVSLVRRRWFSRVFQVYTNTHPRTNTDICLYMICMPPWVEKLIRRTREVYIYMCVCGGGGGGGGGEWVSEWVSEWVCRYFYYKIDYICNHFTIDIDRGNYQNCTTWHNTFRWCFIITFLCAQAVQMLFFCVQKDGGV